jgi:hypothetical protein
MSSIKDQFLITISYGRILNIINYCHQVNKQNEFLEVSIDLGTEIIKQYLLDSYREYLKHSSAATPAPVHSDSLQIPANTNTKISLLMWKNKNKSLVESTKESEFKYQLGVVLVNFMVELKLIKIKLKILSRTEKRTILVPGDRLEKLIASSNAAPVLISLPNKLPMIVKPKSYLYKDSTSTPHSSVQPCSHNIVAGLANSSPETNCESLAEFNQVGRTVGEYTSTDDNNQLGGYLLNGIEYTDEIISKNWELKTESNFLLDNSVYDMVNFVNSVQFKINENVLDFILANNNKYNFFINSNYNHELTSKKSNLTKAEALKLKQWYSQRFIEQNILGLATLYREVPSFYLPVRLDYRGRLYCIVEYLNYQNIELAKSLLEFSVGEKVYLNKCSALGNDAINYLKIFGANNYGNKLDKKSFYDRIAWVDENSDNIINFRNGVLLNKAENKLLFLSFCFEFNKYIQALNNKKELFITNLPIQLDAAVNGFQHLTLLVDDLSLSKELNLDSCSWKDIPKDFYTFVGFKVKEIFINKLKDPDANLSEEEKASYSKLSLLNMFRNLIKHAIMTMPYNASPLTIVDSMKESFEKLPNPDYNFESFSAKIDIYNKSKDSARYTSSVKDKNNKEALKQPVKGLADWVYVYRLKSDPSIIFTELDFKNLRKALNNAIYIDYPKLSALLDYLKTIADISNKLNLPIPWILPTGLVVQQQFFATEKMTVKPFIYTKNKLNLTTINKKKCNDRKQKVALMPNLIHSLDAASLCLVINNYFNQEKFVVAQTQVKSNTNSTNKTEAIIGIVRSNSCPGARASYKLINNINFYSIHDCFAVPCNKMSQIIELLKFAYIIIYSKKSTYWILMLIF